MKYRVGNLTVGFEGNSHASDVLQDILQPLKSETNEPAGLEYHFVDRLPGFAHDSHVRLSNFWIGEDRVQIDEALWHEDVSSKDNVLQVRVAPVAEPPLSSITRDVRKSWRYLHTFGREGSLHRVRNCCFGMYLPMLQLALLNNGATFCHASAIERDGRAVLFPAWGGVGKSGLMSKYMSEGWNFLSDDLCVLDASGTASLHPLPLHIYKYHEIQCPELVEQMLKGATAWESRLWRLFGPFKRPNRMVRWIKPGTVFGEDRLARTGAIATVIHLYRDRNGDQFQHRPISPDEAATRIASNLFSEIEKLVNLAITVQSCRPVSFMPPVGEMYRRIHETCVSAFAGADCYSLGIPWNATADDTRSFIDGHQLLEQG